MIVGGDTIAKSEATVPDDGLSKANRSLCQRPCQASAKLAVLVLGLAPPVNLIGAALNCARLIRSPVDFPLIVLMSGPPSGGKWRERRCIPQVAQKLPHPAVVPVAPASCKLLLAPLDETNTAR
jgi:hypothetical protein